MTAPFKLPVWQAEDDHVRCGEGKLLATLHGPAEERGYIVRALNERDDLLAMLEAVLCVSELNADDMEPETRATLERAMTLRTKCYEP